MNSRRYTMTSLSIVFLALTIMSVSAIGQNAYAAGGGMSLSADCSGSSCDVSGINAVSAAIRPGIISDKLKIRLSSTQR